MLLVLNVGSRKTALVVDAVLGAKEVVVKGLGRLGRVPGVLGSTVLGDGSIVLIADPVEIARSGGINRPLVELPRAALQRAGLKIMIVDDSPSVRRVTGGLIAGAGWEGVAAKDGLDALEQLAAMEPPPDLILLDVEMPRMDGFEFLSTLRASDEFRELPVIMVSSRSGEKHRRKANEFGATDYVVKPYLDEALLAVIRRHARKPIGVGRP